MYINLKPEWPNKKKFAVCLTHDVDRVKKTHQYFTRFIRFFKKMEIRKAFDEIFYFFKFYFNRDLEKDPYWNFEIIVDIEKKFGVKSTFFFLNETGRMNIFKPETWKLYLGRYNINNPEVVKIMKNLNSEGWEIGLHGSYNSYKNRDILVKEKKRLEEIIGNKVIGIRQHYLNLEIPKTWKIQHEIGFLYDASFGSNMEIGFREEKYLPFCPLDNQFLVIPLTIMDSTLFKNSNNINEAWEKCEDLINIAEKRGALMTVLWHSQVFNEKEYLGWSLIYEKIIKVCKEKDAWITTANDIVKWWN